MYGMDVCKICGGEIKYRGKTLTLSRVGEVVLCDMCWMEILSEAEIDAGVDGIGIGPECME
jgi:hypothetical protein